jgi:MoxR-like ATPase
MTSNGPDLSAPTAARADLDAGPRAAARDDAAAFAAWFDRLAANVERVIHGKADVVRLAVVALFAEGHLLLEDVPGVGKTMLARALSASIAGEMRRIQFTPDLLPSDVTGVSVFHQQLQRFEFHEGPVFANLVLADEINRASPKTQSALLEVMSERRVSVDGTQRPVPRPFLVIATQNPIELEGTYRLPEAELDRFLIRTTIGHPDVAAEIEILRSHGSGASVVDNLPPVMTADQAAALVRFAETVHASDGVLAYIASIADATRRQADLRLGASPRGSLGLLRAARVLAASEGRTFVTPEDVKFRAEPVLGHRVILTPEAELQGHTGAEVVRRCVERVPLPHHR